MLARGWRSFALGLTGAIVGTALASTAFSAETGGILNLIVQPEPISLNPGINRLGPATFVGNKIYDSLLGYSAKDITPIPRLAESWEIPADGKTYTFKLRSGVTWHDGEPFTSKDVAFSIGDFLPIQHARSKDLSAQIDHIETPDDLTVVFRLKAPYPAFLWSLNVAIVPAHKYVGVTDLRTAPANSEFIGTGPFKFSEWKKGSSIRLVRNDKYWDAGKPYLDEIDFQIVPDANSRAIAFETGQVDVLRSGDVENFDIPRLSALEGVAINEGGWEFLQPIGYVHINNRNPVLANQKVRQAITQAINRDFIINTIFAGYGKPINGPFSSLSAYKDVSVETTYPYDPKQAAALLDEAGYKADADGTRFTLKLVPLPYGELWSRQAEYLREALGAVGIKVEIQSVDVAGWFKRLTTFDYDIAQNFVYTAADPGIGISYGYKTVKGDNAGSTGGNINGYSNPEVDALLDQGAHEQDDAKRKEIYSKVQKILSHDVPMVWTHDIVFPTLYRDRVQDLITTALGTDDNFANVWLKK
ncbi:MULTISPECIES: ABC transporter substrate-binding protein [unclassified Ochrobactrum]|uniref:ABC transporter substrate-binding protein n=1 Tax=unclassified Ochrobactrum TaxID=239106 RepID=UPI000DEFD172|nr:MULTISPECIES: ABC transporter substrate-binding protein [unclassified Ochrobactrum]MBQ0711280.1 ABC transporter substrate-binding protein [Ochrobactrum sp. AP1BH01-1]